MYRALHTTLLGVTSSGSRTSDRRREVHRGLFARYVLLLLVLFDVVVEVGLGDRRRLLGELGGFEARCEVCCSVVRILVW